MYLQAGTIRYGFYGADGATHEYSCSPTIAPDQFSMVTFVYTMGTGGSIKCYINGREQTGTWVAGNGASTPHTSAGTQAFEIGHWFGTPSNMLPRYYFKGRIDEPIVAARAFSADEIRGLYTNSGRDATKSCHPGSANLKGAWRLNEASGTTVASETVSTNGTSTSSSNIVDGRWGKARAFGVNTGVAVGAATPLKIMWGDLTISATVLPNSENAYIAGYATSNANWGLYSIFLEQGYPSYGYYGGGVHQKYRCGVPLPVHRFSTVTFTYERGLAGGTMACYIDGEPVSGTWISGTGNSPPEDFPGSMAFEIGHWYGTTASLEKYWFDGVIDEVLVYNEKLSAAAIKASSCR